MVFFVLMSNFTNSRMFSLVVCHIKTIKSSTPDCGSRSRNFLL